MSTIETILHCLRGVRPSGSDKWQAFCPAHDDRNKRSLSLRIQGDTVLSHCFAGCSFEDVSSALGLEPKDFFLRASTEPHVSRRQALRPVPECSSNDNGDLARDIWDESVDIRATDAERYLSRRGIHSVPSHCLRYHPSLLNTGSGRKYPALVAAVTTVGSEVVQAIQRVYLDGDRKADVEPAKMSLGPVSGGAVMLGKPGEVLGLAEGVETALSAQQLSGDIVWAILGSNLDKVLLPPLPLASTIKIYADGDEAGRRAMLKAGDRYSFQQRHVWDCSAPDGRDYNDVLVDEKRK